MKKNNDEKKEVVWARFDNICIPGKSLEDCANKYQQILDKKIVKDRKCPLCGSTLLIRTNKKGITFIGCSNFPKCRYIENKSS